MNFGDVKCPSCRKAMKPVKLHCSKCNLSLEGNFNIDGLEGLDSEDMALAIAFIRSFGSIKKLQNILGVSYPTARIKLENLVMKLNNGMEMEPDKEIVIDKLQSGEISVSEALEEL